MSSDLIRYLAIATCIGLALFIWRELTTDRPAVNLRILKDINFSSGTFLGGILVLRCCLLTVLTRLQRRPGP